ncbi:MAG: hypothetical protein JO079_13855 [Frankiaceae bacterium]|nr:hypothetical protein [Frankiaceae bacterium]MBV9369095.1 hypothetical protein [Frankiales bacterium]
MRTLVRAGIAGALAVGCTAGVLTVTSAAHSSVVSFAGGELVVYRVGDGASPLSNAAAPVFLDWLHADGSLDHTVAVPTTTSGVQHRLTSVGYSTSEGTLSRSPDGHWLAFAGYDAAPGTFGPTGAPQSLAASAPASVPRVVGLLNGDGTLDTSTALTGASTPQVVRAAATLDGQGVWATGSTGGVLAAVTSSATAPAVVAAGNYDTVGVYGGQLFAAGSGAGPQSVGTGAPTAGAATVTSPPGLPAHLLTGGLAFLDLDGAVGYGSTGLDTLYVVNESEQAGAVDKYRYDGANWVKAGSVAIDGAESLVASAAGSVVSLAVTTPSSVVTLTDPNGTDSGSFTPSTTPAVLATAPSGTEFRGIALAPTAPANPTAFLRAPDVSTTVSALADALPVAVDAYSPHGIASVTAHIDSTAVRAATHGAGSRWTVSLPVTTFAAGLHTLHVLVTDASGSHTTTSLSRSFQIAPLVVPSGDIGPGTWSFVQRLVTHSSTFLKTYYKPAPGHYGLRTVGKGSVVFTSYGRKVVLYAIGGRDAGVVKVTIGSHTYAYDLYRPTTRLVALTFSWSTIAARRVAIYAPHTKDRYSTGYVVFLGDLVVTK